MKVYSEEYISIKSERLKVDISKPGSFYRGVRFDWTSFITQVTLDNKHEYCTREPVQKGATTNGWGLCSQFKNFVDIENDDSPGKLFPVLGIGLVRPLQNKPFNVFNAYEILPYPMTMEVIDSSCIVFKVEPIICRSIAVYLEKTIAVKQNTLEINYLIKNTGDVCIDTSEYNHNFIKIDNVPIGPEYELSFPYKPNIELIPKEFVLKSNSIFINEIPESSFYCHVNCCDDINSHMWELKCHKAGAGMREIDNFSAHKIALWGTKDVISPEIFNHILINPGETYRFSRKYEFFAF